MAEKKTVYVLAADDRTSAAFDSLTRRFSAVDGTIGRMSGSLTGLGATLTGIFSGAGVAGIGLFVKNMIDAAAKLDDMSEKTGAAVGELSKLEQVARIGGHAMDGVETTLTRLAKALHGTDEESKGAGKALAALGLKADELRNKDTAEALRIVAVELNRYQDGAGKTALAIDLLGKSGAQALPFLKDLANEQGIQARITTEQAAKAEELGKQWARMINDAQNLGRAVAFDLVPPLIQLAGVMREVQGDGIISGIGRGLGVALSSGSIAEQIRDTREKLASPDLITRAKEMVGLGEQDRRSLEARLRLLLAIQRQQALALPGGDTKGEMQRFALPGQQLTMAYESAEKAVRGTRIELDKLATRFKGKDDQEARQYYENIFGPEAAGLSIDDLKTKLKATIDGAQALQDTWDRMGRTMGGFNEDGSPIDKFVKEHEQAAAQVNAFWDEAFRNMQRSSSDFLFDAMQGQLGDFSNRFKATVDRMVADWLAAQALMSAKNFITNYGGKTDFGYVVGKALNLISGTQSGVGVPVTEGIPSWIAERASGGPVSAGRPYLIGERGPEIMMPRSSGTVLPNEILAALTKGGAGTVVNLTVNYNAPAGGGFGETARQTARAVERVMGRR